jgi:hypothetical protein
MGVNSATQKLKWAFKAILDKMATQLTHSLCTQSYAQPVGETL